MGQVFISFSCCDIDDEKHLIQTLETLRLDNWLDQEDIEPAADRSERIQVGIESADNFIDVINPAFLQSSECRQELDFTIHNCKRLIPISDKEIDSQLVPTALASINWIFSRDGGDDFRTPLHQLRVIAKE